MKEKENKSVSIDFNGTENLIISEVSEDRISLKINDGSEFEIPKKDFFKGVDKFEKLIRPVTISRLDEDLEEEILIIAGDCVDEIRGIGTNENIPDIIRRVKEIVDSVFGKLEKLFLFNTILSKLDGLYPEPNGMQKNVLNSVTEMMGEYNLTHNGFNGYFKFQRN